MRKAFFARFMMDGIEKEMIVAAVDGETLEHALETSINIFKRYYKTVEFVEFTEPVRSSKPHRG